MERPSKCCMEGCKKKLSVLDYACKCEKYHCSAHRPAEVHSCTFDYRADYRKVLNVHMSTSVIANKVEHI